MEIGPPSDRYPRLSLGSPGLGEGGLHADAGGNLAPDCHALAYLAPGKSRLNGGSRRLALQAVQLPRHCCAQFLNGDMYVGDFNS